ncbi:MAG: YdaS family helix-turn-helix protein [Asticcacaulis sp.]
MKRISSPTEALSEAIAIAGSQGRFARLCDVSQPSVWRWVNSSGTLPAEHVLKVESATGVSRHDLRPDLYPRDEVITKVLARDDAAAHGNPCGTLDEGGVA